MNLDDLNNTQLLLLTVLVNFVTSIAVGVLTVSLLDQAPPTVTQTVNRIVDHTVETIASTTPIQSIITAPQTVVIRDEDLQTAAIAANLARTVSIYYRSTSTPPVAVGTYLPKAKAIATASTAGLPKEVIVVFADGRAVPASLSKVGASIAVYGFADNAALPTVPTPNLALRSTLKPGQIVLGIGTGGSAVTGIVSKIGDTIETNLSSVQIGSAAVTSSGNILGIAIDSSGTFAAADKINTLLSATSTAQTP